ncbi:MAG: hypothetical protein QG573_1229 [Acidobacteriota bacterium]|nr:hypothetical protein [Acidobacteriota bacterium]
MSARARLRRRRSRWGAAGLVAILLAAWASAGRLPAQVMDASWRTVDTGGGVAALGIYSVSGTAGQPDAGAPLVAGIYRVEGGFWPAAVSMQSNLIFADGFASGNTAAWTATVPLGGGRGRPAR